MIIIITGFRLPALVFKPGRGPPELVHLTVLVHYYTTSTLVVVLVHYY